MDLQDFSCESNLLFRERPCLPSAGLLYAREPDTAPCSFLQRQPLSAPIRIPKLLVLMPVPAFHLLRRAHLASNCSFVVFRSSVLSNVVSLLHGVAHRARSPDLGLIASRAELDSSLKVKTAIDTFITHLRKAPRHVSSSK